MVIEYTLDPRLSRFTVQAIAAGMLSALAHSPTFAVREFNGIARLEISQGTDVATAQVVLAISAGSLELLDDLRPRDRQEILQVMRDKVLEVGKFPEIRFESDIVPVDKMSDATYALRLAGKLLLHGTTRDHPVNAKLLLFGDSIRISGECAVRQSDFGIQRVKAAAGMIQTKDDVKLTYELVGRKVEPGA